MRPTWVEGTWQTHRASHIHRTRFREGAGSTGKPSERPRRSQGGSSVCRQVVRVPRYNGTSWVQIPHPPQRPGPVGPGHGASGANGPGTPAPGTSGPARPPGPWLLAGAHRRAGGRRGERPACPGRRGLEETSGHTGVSEGSARARHQDLIAEDSAGARPGEYGRTWLRRSRDTGPEHGALRALWAGRPQPLLSAVVTGEPPGFGKQPARRWVSSSDSSRSASRNAA